MVLNMFDSTVSFASIGIYNLPLIVADNGHILVPISELPAEGFSLEADSWLQSQEEFCCGPDDKEQMKQVCAGVQVVSLPRNVERTGKQPDEYDMTNDSDIELSADDETQAMYQFDMQPFQVSRSRARHGDSSTTTVDKAMATNDIGGDQHIDACGVGGEDHGQDVSRPNVPDALDQGRRRDKGLPQDHEHAQGVRGESSSRH